jgi:hypothetical protein
MLPTGHAQTVEDYPRALREADRQQLLRSRQRILDLRNIDLFVVVRPVPSRVRSGPDAPRRTSWRRTWTGSSDPEPRTRGPCASECRSARRSSDFGKQVLATPHIHIIALHASVDCTVGVIGVFIACALRAPFCQSLG